ncbi:hypothetical protein SPHV1_2360001 [Novosphingobium sp. KN65.2]|nr:hypothetical protein SPHV1_2360001 [Novosphingobium sp. KN65.2]
MPSTTALRSTIKPGNDSLLSHAFATIDHSPCCASARIHQLVADLVKSARNVSQTQFCAPVDILARGKKRHSRGAGVLILQDIINVRLIARRGHRWSAGSPLAISDLACLASHRSCSRPTFSRQAPISRAR